VYCIHGQNMCNYVTQNCITTEKVVNISGAWMEVKRVVMDKGRGKTKQKEL
jgi:hypothetical protein